MTNINGEPPLVEMSADIDDDKMSYFSLQSVRLAVEHHRQRDRIDTLEEAALIADRRADYLAGTKRFHSEVVELRTLAAAIRSLKTEQRA